MSDDDLENVAGGSDGSDIVSGIISLFTDLGDMINSWTRRRW